MVNIYSDSKVFILCPYDGATGGPETLHQLSFRLQELGVAAHMVYFPFGKTPAVAGHFKKYKPVAAGSIEDEERNVLVIPEVYVHILLDTYKKVRKVIWWLSVDNYLNLSSGGYLLDTAGIKARNFVHIVQSTRTKAYLLDHGIKTDAYLSGYINSEYLTYDGSSNKRDDNVLFNPSKGYAYTSKLIHASPDLNWVALTGMSPGEIRQTFLSGKVYIDFGHHPGRDRLPREAGAMGCCIITGLQGSAAFFEDLPIPGEFKFDQAHASLEEIISKIQTCLTEYRAQQSKFNDYSALVRNEERKFVTDLQGIFHLS